MTSTSTLGSTAITNQFVLNRDIDGAANEVQGAINAAAGQLPKDLPSPPTYRKVNPANSPILLLAATSETMPLTDVNDNVETKLAQQISQLPGAAQVTIGGQQKPAVRIQLDPAKLVAKGRRSRTCARRSRLRPWMNPRARLTAGRDLSRFTPTTS
jgi:HAE1 family hydrophobic/amphiphilic exporter-1